MTFIDRIKNAFPANRVAAVATFLTALGAEIAALSDAFPGTAGDNIALVGGLATQAAVAITFLFGSQKWDQLQAQQVPVDLHPDFDEELGAEDEPVPGSPAPSAEVYNG